MLVLPVPGASTGIGVSSPCRTSSADHLPAQKLGQRLQRRRGRAEPARERRGRQVDAVARVDLGLAIQRQVIVKLRHRDVGQEPRTGPPAGHRMVGGRRLDHQLASAAGERLAHVAHDLEPAWHIVEALGHVLADPAQAPAAGRAGAGTGMDHALARQVRRQVPPSRSGSGGLPRLGDDRRAGQALGLVDLQRLDGQFELLEARAELLGRGAEARPLQPGELAAQLLDEGAGMNGLARQADDQALERVDVVGQRGRIESHANSLALAKGRRHRFWHLA